MEPIKMTKEERLEKAKELYKTANADQRYVLECLFSELAESEDERIRKELIQYLEEYTNLPNGQYSRADFFTWLEKQGEKGVVLRDTFGYEEGRQRGREEGVMLVLNNPRKYGLEKQYEQKPAETEKGAKGNDREIPNSAWSEDDEAKLKSILFHIEDVENKDVIDWLKSLKDRFTWKPSDEQMADLWNMVCECRPADQQLLQDLYYGLKTLRGE